MSRREFANLKELQDFARRNRKLYALEETAKFAERQRGSRQTNTKSWTCATRKA
jgi:hypothetical protein